MFLCTATPFGFIGHKRQIQKLFVECDGGESTELILKKIKPDTGEKDGVVGSTGKLVILVVINQVRFTVYSRHVLSDLLMNLLQISTGSCFNQCLEDAEQEGCEMCMYLFRRHLCSFSYPFPGLDHSVLRGCLNSDEITSYDLPSPHLQNQIYSKDFINLKFCFKNVYLFFSYHTLWKTIGESNVIKALKLI